MITTIGYCLTPNCHHIKQTILCFSQQPLFSIRYYHSLHTTCKVSMATTRSFRGGEGDSSIRSVKVKVKVKFILEQATKAQRGSRGIDLLFL